MAVLRAQRTVKGRKIQAYVRKGGFTLSRVFWKTGDAREWSRRVEDAISSSTPDHPFDKSIWLNEGIEPSPVDDSSPHSGWTLKKALEHYATTISPTKKGGEPEARKAKGLQSKDIAQLTLEEIRRDDLQKFVDGRIAEGRAVATARLELMLIRSIYRDAISTWKIAGLNNPAIGVILPRVAPHRQRRFEDGAEEGDTGEEQRLRDALSLAPAGPEMLDLLDIALETGMRQAEVLGICAGQLKRIRGAKYIEQMDSKNGDPRRVTLSSKAGAIIERRAKGKNPIDKLFTMTPADLRQRWNSARKSAGVTGFRWHDLRHEALSRMAGLGLNIGELQAQSGHRTASVLLRYVNSRPQDVAKKLG